MYEVFISYWMSGLAPSAFAYWILTLLVVGICSGAILLFFGTLVPDLNMMFQCYILTTLVCFICLGLSPSLHTLNPLFSWFQFISVPRYAYVNLIIAEYNALENLRNTIWWFFPLSKFFQQFLVLNMDGFQNQTIRNTLISDFLQIRDWTNGGIGLSMTTYELRF